MSPNLAFTLTLHGSACTKAERHYRGDKVRSEALSCVRLSGWVVLTAQDPHKSCVWTCMFMYKRQEGCQPPGRVCSAQHAASHLDSWDKRYALPASSAQCRARKANEGAHLCCMLHADWSGHADGPVLMQPESRARAVSAMRAPQSRCTREQVQHSQKSDSNGYESEARMRMLYLRKGVC